MKIIFNNILRVSKFMNVIAGVTLTFMMLITVADVILRYLGRPILGSYELVSFSGAVIMGFALPFTSWIKSHIYVDFFVLKLPKKRMLATLVVTRILNIVFFMLTGIYLLKKGMDLFESGEVSLTLQMPFYPIVYGMGICCFLVGLVFLCEIVKLIGENYE